MARDERDDDPRAARLVRRARPLVLARRADAPAAQRAGHPHADDAALRAAGRVRPSSTTRPLQIDTLSGEKAATVQADRTNKGQLIVDFDTVTALRIKYTAYFPEESGVGQHLHDIEPTEVRVVVGRANGTLARDQGYVCDSLDYLIVVIRVTGEGARQPLVLQRPAG